MAANRKLLSEIQQVLKKIEEGVEIFDETIGKVYAAETQALKEKFESDLKKEIKKLQRLRDQVKNWIGSNEVKDKGQLTEAKKLIESKMELFKICEKDTKTKAYSKEGLAREAKLDPKEAAREEKRQWLNDCLEQLQDFINTVEAEKEKAQNTKGKGKNKEGNLEKYDNRIQKNKWHMAKIEIIIRLLDSEEIDPSSLDNIKDSLEYYLETAAEDDGALGVEHEFDIYEDLNLDSFTANHFDISPRAQQGETPLTSAEQPDDKSPVPLTLPEKEPQPEKPVEKVNQPVEISHPKQLPPAGSTPVAAPKSSKPTPVVAANANHDKEKQVTPITSPPTHSNAHNQPAKTATINANLSHSNDSVQPAPVAHSPSVVAGISSNESTLPNRPHITAAQIVSQNLTPPSVTAPHAPVHSTPAPVQQPLVHTNPSVLAPPVTQPVAPLQPQTILSPAVQPSAILQPIPNSNALADDLDKLQIGRVQPSLQPVPPQSAHVPPKITSPQAMSLQQPIQMQQQLKGSPVKVPPVSGFGTVNSVIAPEITASGRSLDLGMKPVNLSGVNDVPSGVNLSGILGSSTPSSLMPSPSAANPPGLTAEMLNTLAMLKQSATFLPEPDQEKGSTYTPRNLYNTHPLFPTTPLYSNQDCTQLFDKLSWDTFFFAFYFQQGSYQQYLAAKKLKKGSWRFHRKYTTWFQRHNEPKITTKDYEEGTYLYFDFESGWCNRIKTEFKFEYAFLEDEVNI